MDITKKLEESVLNLENQLEKTRKIKNEAIAIENTQKMERDKLVLAAVAEGYTGVLNIFLARGGDVNTAKLSSGPFGGFSLLHAAAICGHKETVEVLLKAGADVHAKNNDGQTAIKLAMLEGHKSVVKMLLDKGATIKVHDGSDAKSSLDFCYNLMIEKKGVQ